MGQSDSLSQSFMLLSFAAAALLVSVQLQAKRSEPFRERSAEQRDASETAKLDSFDRLRADIRSKMMQQAEAIPSPSSDASSVSATSHLTLVSEQPQSVVDVPSTQVASAPLVSAASQSSVTATETIGPLITAPVQQTWSALNPFFTALTTPTSDPVAEVDHIRVVIDLSDRLVYAYSGNQLRHSFPIAVGKAGWETPTGEFSVIEKRLNPSWQHPITQEIFGPGPDNPLGSHWIAFWTNGRNKIGFHGTNDIRLIGQAVSHGCVRMNNDDIQALYETVDIGTTVIVQP